MPPHRTIKPCLAAGFAVLLGCACDGPGNTGKILPDPTLVRAVPWLNGVLPAVEGSGPDIMAVIPSLPVYPPIASGLADPGSQRTDCAATAGYEFSTGWFDNFEPLSDAPSATGVAAGWSSYDNLSQYAFHTPGDASWYPALLGTTFAAWGMPAERSPGPACDARPNNWVLHFRGGLFRKWGGGMSHAFVDPVGLRYRADAADPCRPADVDFCPPPPAMGAVTDSAGLPLKPASDPYLQSHDFFDLSRYEGLAFWARRGPEGHDRALVILTDKFTSSRLARENQTYCRRIRECHSACLSGAPCSPDSPDPATAVHRCFYPKVGLPIIANESLFELMYPRCGPSACTSPTSYRDADFDGKACRPHAFPAADEHGEFCWNADDPPPPSRDERCQDGWQVSIELTPDWRFYALPFSQFGQVGFGKRAPFMDLKSIDTMAFGATMGWSDMYFDNVTFYRRKK